MNPTLTKTRKPQTYQGLKIVARSSSEVSGELPYASGVYESDAHKNKKTPNISGLKNCSEEQFRSVGRTAVRLGRI
jgi:hypothetical protein